MRRSLAPGVDVAREHHDVEVAGLRRALPLFEVAPDVRIAVLNILGDVELVEACARALAVDLDATVHDVLVTAEAKSIPLAHALAVATGIPYVVLRKVRRVYMGETIAATTTSITTGGEQTLHLDEKDRALLDGARVVLVDDVISTGSTSRGMRAVVARAGGRVVGEVAIFTEGDERPDVVALGHLPIFPST